MHDRTAFLFVGIIALTPWGLSTESAAADPAAKCEAAKVKAVGKHMACRAKAESKGAKSATATDPTALGKCDAKFSSSWDKAQDKGAGQCADPPGADAALTLATAAACTDWAAAYIEGVGDSDICASSCAPCEADLSTCEADLGTCQGDEAQCQSDLVTCQADESQCQTDLTTCEDDLAQASDWTAITPVVVFSAGTGGTGPTVYSHASDVPSDATHGVFTGTMTTNGADASINWFGINGNLSQRTDRIFNTPNAAGSTVKTILLPFGPSRTSKWDSGVNSGATVQLELVGYMKLSGLSVAE